ncbi:MAG: TIGR00730 family Rossman fold protein [Halomonadaceae bacterium]|nr:MAG: TIGR00730 family Rossman fold protein [Halomonadaceae bacterium]
MVKAASVAHEDREFLSSEEGRPLRVLAEYLKPMSAFHKAGIRDTVVFFGSARLQEDGPLGHYYQDARELARLVTEWSQSLPCHSQQFVVCSGGGGGIMEAANRGAADAGGRSIGLNIGLPHEQRPNAFITPQLQLEFRYFFMRKLWFAHLARAMIAFPGGLGTLDELCEILTLSQTRKLSRPIRVYLYGRSYWEEIINFPALVRHGMISEKDLELFQYVDTPAEALRLLQDGLVEDLDDLAPAFAGSRFCDTE